MVNVWTQTSASTSPVTSTFRKPSNAIPTLSALTNSSLGLQSFVTSSTSNDSPSSRIKSSIIPTLHFTTPPISPPASPYTSFAELEPESALDRSEADLASSLPSRSRLELGDEQLAGLAMSEQAGMTFAPPSMTLDKFFGTTVLSTTASGAAVAMPINGFKKFGGAGSFANSAKGKMAQAKKAKAIKAQQIKAEKIKTSAAAQVKSTPHLPPKSENEDDDEDEDEDQDYDEGDDEAQDDYDSYSEDEDSYYNGNPAAPAALSPESTYTFKPLHASKPLPTKSIPPAATDSDEDDQLHVEYASQKDFVDSVTKDEEVAPTAYADQRRYSSDSDAHGEDKERDEYRGRSRRPRLLWRSHLTNSTVGVLDNYCREYYAIDGLPQLRNRGSPEGKRWSRKLDKAGL